MLNRCSQPIVLHLCRDVNEHLSCTRSQTNVSRNTRHKNTCQHRDIALEPLHSGICTSARPSGPESVRSPLVCSHCALETHQVTSGKKKVSARKRCQHQVGRRRQKVSALKKKVSAPGWKAQTRSRSRSSTCVNHSTSIME